MHELDRDHWPDLRGALGAERCCSLHARHVTSTGHGRIWVDRWPSPRVTIAFTGGNLGLLGDPAACGVEEIDAVLRALLSDWERVFIDPGDGFADLVAGATETTGLWPRVLYALPGRAVEPEIDDGAEIRALGPGDAEALAGLHPSITWIADTHDGALGLATSEHAVGAFVDGRLASVAAVFYAGERYEELGVVTDPDHLGRGLSPRCCAPLIARILARGRTPCWSTTPDNAASQRVAEKLGFRFESEQRHFVAGAHVTGTLPFD